MSLYKISQDLNNGSLRPGDKYLSFVDFKAYYDKLCADVLKKQIFTDDQLAQHIFKSQWQDNQQEIVLKKFLFAAKNTLERYEKIVNPKNFLKFNFVLRMLVFDMFGIIRYAEKTYRGNDLNIDMGTRPDQTAREIFDVSEGLLHIGTIEPEKAYLREVIPVSIFLLRQTIEVFGKRALGYHSITNSMRTRIPQVSTQVAWDFIKAETLRSNSRIILSANIDTIKKVEGWTNRYIHTGFIPEIFLIENAIHFVRALIYPINTVRNYRNSVRYNGTTQIHHYNELKADFEKFVNRPLQADGIKRIWVNLLISFRIKKKPKARMVNWLETENVDATILSL